MKNKISIKSQITSKSSNELSPRTPTKTHTTPLRSIDDPHLKTSKDYENIIKKNQIKRRRRRDDAY